MLINLPLCNFYKKSAVYGFLMYYKFANKIYTKEGDPIRQTYYTTKTIFGRFYDYFYNLGMSHMMAPVISMSIILSVSCSVVLYGENRGSLPSALLGYRM